MALIACDECGQQKSSAAKACPHCGKSRDHISGGVVWFAIVGVVVFFLGINFLSTDTFNVKNPEDKVTAPVANISNYRQPKPENSLKGIADYIGRFNVDVAVNYDVEINSVGNILIDNDDYRVSFETLDNIVTLISIGLKGAEPCTFGQKITNYDEYISYLGLHTADLKINRNSTNSTVRYTIPSGKGSLSILCPSSSGTLTVYIRSL
ncbi:hypothetical protein GCM10009347_01910 [Shewanella algicola]|uniref:Uncharacterized protein n=1 Tax=Shewanella algicola TaxID=640633 RepID=A0A9X2CC41_9GAMM|nr:hypothetical protein [Shewanella algicola]MCL1103707.1 hypothetical protein [Shewanella algicola]GGP37562.1 hypothetical protein GCM10009347_01910 [Shewanella algicola]